MSTFKLFFPFSHELLFNFGSYFYATYICLLPFLGTSFWFIRKTRIQNQNKGKKALVVFYLNLQMAYPNYSHLEKKVLLKNSLFGACMLPPPSLRSNRSACPIIFITGVEHADEIPLSYNG